MANQIFIDIGAVANDGTGDPLRTAFDIVNDNFSNVWNTGLPTSNITFSGNRILTTNANGNLILAPNGIAKVVANVDIVPNMNIAHSLGAPERRWNTVYTQYLDVTGEVTFPGDVTINGNLTVEGDTIQIGNIVTDTKTIQLSNTAATANSANGSGVTVGANDNIATMLYDSTGNVWDMNIGITALGNITAPYFFGNGSQLTGLGGFDSAGTDPYTINLTDGSLFAVVNAETINTSSSMILIGKNYTGYGEFLNENFIHLLENSSSNIAPVAPLTGQLWWDTNLFYLKVWNGLEWQTLGPGRIENGLSSVDIPIANGNVSINAFSNTWDFGIDGNLTVPGNIVPAGNNTQSLGNATNQWSDLWVSNATIYFNSVPLTLTAGNVLTIGGEPILSNDSDTNITTTGNITADFFIGDGSQLTGISSTGNIIFDNTTISAPNTEPVIIQATDTVVRSQLRLDPNDGLTKLTSFSGEQNWLFTTSDWSTGTWTDNGFGSGIVDFTNAPNIIAFIESNNFNNAVNITFSINGGEPIPYEGASYGGGNINFGTGALLPDPDPTTVTSIEFYYQLESYIQFDWDDDELNVVTPNMSINIQADNDINIQTNDDIVLTAGDDVFIVTNNNTSGYQWTFDNFGNLIFPTGANTDGLNFNGGTASATVALNAFSPDGNTVSVRAQGNTSTAMIETYDSANSATKIWQFDNVGKLTAPGSIEIGTGDSGVQLRSNPTGTGFYADIANITNGSSTVVVTLFDVEFTEGDQGTVRITGVEGETEANGFWGWQAVEVDQIQLYTDGTLSTPVDGTTWSAYVSGGLAVSSGYNILDIQGGNVSIITGAGKYWSFNPDGNLVLPQGGTISEGPSPSFLGDAVTITPANGTDADQQLKIYPTFAEGNHLHLTTGNLYNTELYVGDDNLYVKLANTGDVVINSNDSQGNTAQWTFDTNGGLTVPIISTGGEGETERAEIRGTRTIVGDPGTWSTYIPGHSAFGNVAWTASGTNIQSARITFVIQTNGTAFNWEQFDVAVCKLDGANAVVSISNRIRQNSAIDYTEVSAYENEGYLTVWLNPADGQTSGYVNYHAVEFSIMPD